MNSGDLRGAKETMAPGQTLLVAAVAKIKVMLVVPSTTINYYHNFFFLYKFLTNKCLEHFSSSKWLYYPCTIILS